ncbi:MAG: CYTH domain-containing protein [Muribaculaceae bacterium]|nr:CYTH domain-containing protein [Muribaculaceae bacterium]
MGKEIERKFLVRDNAYLDMATEAIEMAQGYLNTSPDATVRVRVCGQRAYLTVKSRNRGAERGEWEYEIPRSEADDIMAACCGPNVLSKTRYIVPYAGHIWEVDVFSGRLAGLVVAEVELGRADESVIIPPFVGKEVTGDTRYYNSTLSCPSTPLPPTD